MMLFKTAEGLVRFSKWQMAIAFLFLTLGMAFALSTYSFLQRAVPSKGTVVELVESQNKNGDTLYAAVFTFADADGKQHKVVSSSATNPPIGLVGDEIYILFDPQDPQRVEENRFFSLWGFTAIPIGLGVFYFLLFWLVAYWAKRWIKSVPPHKKKELS